MHVGFGDDLDERHTGTIQIDERLGRRVDQLAGVFFHVDAMQTHAADLSARRQRLFELRDLISLGQVGIEIVLAREDGVRVNLATVGDGRAQRQLHRFAVQHRQRSRISEANGADAGVGWGAEGRGAGTENFRRRQKTGMHFQTDDRFPLRHVGRL